ncbi:unnamed protein product [Peronospora belbahrii]|uniref:Peptidase M20 dimerisation domain-containing protein n=1 Tax=Peronospora belbahrii TaxID=622444 RepID=A0AAU9KRE5_9STRA|nr:unnamed protein product [Peronospora belbahrii]
MCEEMRWLEYAHRLHESRRGVCIDTTPETDLAKLLFSYSTKNGARSLDLKVGEIREGYAADFALVDIEEEQLKFSTASSLMGAFIFGANGSSVVTATSVNGKWREMISRKVEKHCFYFRRGGNCGSGNCRLAYRSGLARAHAKVPPQSDSVVKADRYNMYATRSDSKTPRLLFNSHMDTVPPYFLPRIDSTTLYGRGACDAKSLIAGQMIAAQKLVDAGFSDDVQLLFVVSEETDHTGMKKANELNVNPAYMIVGEPTALQMAKLQKGALKIQLTQEGVAAHSGYPHLGDSAIDPMIDVLYALKKENWPTTEAYGSTDLNIDVVYKRVEEIVAGRVNMKLYTDNAPVHLTTVEGYETCIACFIPYFNFDGKAYLVGAGSITNAHCSRESILLEDLRTMVDYYITLGKRLMEVGH